MRTSSRRTIAIVVVALALLLAVPASGIAVAGKHIGAARVRPMEVTPPDIYENDDTTTTARVLPEISNHTFSSTYTTADADWSKVYADTTGTPFVFETQFQSGFFDSQLIVYRLDDAGVPVELVANDDSNVWSAPNEWPLYTFGSTLYFSAPAPGWYFVKARPLNDNTAQQARYTLYESKGIARRIAGPTRFETAAQVSRTMWSDASNGWYGRGGSPDGVIIANGYKFPDALAGAAFSAAGRTGSGTMPILLVGSDAVSPSILAEFTRLQPSAYAGGRQMTLYILGSQSAVSDAVVKQLMGTGSEPFRPEDVVRLGGATRFETAAEIASATSDAYGAPDTVFIVTGRDFADGLAASAPAGKNQSPILYTEVSALPAATGEWITDHPSVTKAVIVGGPTRVGPAVESALAAAPYSLDVTRVAGTTRYITARKLADFGIANYGMRANSILVSGLNFPDGLCAGPMSAMTRGPILLTPGTALSDQVTGFFGDHTAGMLPTPDATTNFPSYIIGGTPTISLATEMTFRRLYTTAD